MEPEEIEYLKTTCEQCQQRIEFPDELYGEQIMCPTCNSQITATPDDEKEDPEQDREWLEEGLQAEQEEGMIAKTISDASKKEMLKAQVEAGYCVVFDLVAGKFPELLTREGRRRLQAKKRAEAEANAEYNKSRRMKEFAPLVTIDKLPARLPDEGIATEKQITFLRDLGVGDESTLSSIGIKQASKLIEKILEERKKLGL